MEQKDKNISPPASDNNNPHELDTMTIDEVLAENKRRNVAMNSAYDPIKGVGCCNSRVPYPFQDEDDTPQLHMIPESMATELESISSLSRKN